MIAGKRSDNSTARQLAPRNAVVVDNSNIARSRSPTNISFGPLKSVKQKREHRSSSPFVYVSTHRKLKLVRWAGSMMISISTDQTSFPLPSRPERIRHASARHVWPQTRSGGCVRQAGGPLAIRGCVCRCVGVGIGGIRELRSSV
jgi:hypothetical protein